MNNHITDTVLLCTLLALSSATQATTENSTHSQDGNAADIAANIMSADKVFAGLIEKRQEATVAEVHSNPSAKKPSHEVVIKPVQSKQVIEAEHDKKRVKKLEDVSSKATLFKKDDAKAVNKDPVKRGIEGQSNITGHVDRTVVTAVTAVSVVKKKRVVGKSTSYTVRGKRYRTLAHSDGFVQTGKASWYGKRFHGRKTASGERFDMNALTAAHKELPLGTKIEVINNDNGKRVVVTVNDRGPFHGDRVLDLSKAAAKQIGAIKRGTANVTIRAL